MLFIKKCACLVFVIAATVLLTACPSETTVSKINGDPARYREKEVVVVGRVVDSYGVMGTGAYELDDGTGRIWVAATRGVPSRGSKVGVKGQFTDSRLQAGTLARSSKRMIVALSDGLLAMDLLE